MEEWNHGLGRTQSGLGLNTQKRGEVQKDFDQVTGHLETILFISTSNQNCRDHHEDFMN